MVLVAWARSPVGASASGAIVAIQDVAFQSAIGLAVLGMAAAVAVRAAAIPVHLWAARLVGAIPPLGVPSSLGWGSGVFAVIAVGWAGSTLGTAGTTLDGWSRGLIAIVAIGGLVLGALASALHDDLEHVLGYWLVGAAGFTLLAFTALGANTAADVADWALGIAGLSTGFAAWIAVTRWTFAGAHRVGALAGWARRSPLLALGLLLLLVGSIGLPGTALAAARSSIAGGLPDPLASVVAVLPAVASIVVFGRLLLAGVERPAGEVAAAARDRLGVLVAPRGGWTGGGATWRARRIVALVRVNRALALGIVVVALCGLAAELAALGTAAAGG
jgi:NADH:ubiquinone oxidoreductase subunit 2 (subunit N)